METSEDEGSGGALEAEPQVTSSDPNERKMARQMRIRRRIEALRKKTIPEGEEEEVEEKSLVHDQLKKSAKLLEKLIIDADEYVTNVRVANDSREADRRDEEGIGRRKIIQQLEEEAEKANEQFNEISAKWTNILKYHDPIHINDAVLEQKEKCDALIRQKDEVIAMLKSEVKEQEMKFSRDQHKQNDDISSLAQRIEKQVLMMRKAFGNEMTLLEEAVMMERKLLMDAHSKKWDELYKKRASEEIYNANKKVEQRNEFEATMKRLTTEFHEKYREVRIELAKDTESLECDLEKIKALSLLNSEKLDYNYQILRKREDENLIIKSQQKRRINKLQDIINNLRHKMRDYERDSNEQIEKLTQQVHKVHDDIFKIEAKADNFQVRSDERFHQLWEMKRRVADGLLEKIFGADRVIFEQLLGIKWVLPEKAVLEKTELPSFKSAMQIVSETLSNKSESLPKKQSKVLEVKASKKKSEATSDAVSVRTEFTEASISSIEQTLQDTVARRRLMRQILKLIADKTGFLLENNLQEILKPYSEEKSMLVKLDNVFAAIGIKKAEDISRMVDFFLPYTYCQICAGDTENSIITSEESEVFIQSFNPGQQSSKDHSQSSEPLSIALNDLTDMLDAVRQPDQVMSNVISVAMNEKSTIEGLPFVEDLEDSNKKDACMSFSASGKQTVSFEADRKSTKEMFLCQNQHPLLISPVYVMRALREFVCSLTFDNEDEPSFNVLMTQRRYNVSRLITQEDIILFWEKYTQTFTPYRKKVWDGLYAGLKKYFAILQDRKKVQDEVLELRKENEELNKLLKSYMDQMRTKGSCSGQREVPLKSPLLDVCRKL